MLAAFLLYWNVNQYHQEKEELVKDLNDQMSLAYGKLNHSIFNSVFKQIGVDTLQQENFHVDVKHMDSKSQTVSFNNLKMDTSFSMIFNPSTINSSLYGSNDFDSTAIHSMDMTKDLSPSFSTKIDLGQLDENERFKPENLEILMERLADSVYEFESMKGYFSDYLHEQGLPVQFDVDSVGVDILFDHASIRVPFLLSMPNNKRYAVFQEYKAYLIQRILPSSMMSGLLFGFVSLAFFFINRTWKTEEQLVKMKSEFSSNMTHELKTPISTVGVAIESLSDFGAMSDPIKRQEYFDISKHELNRLTILVDKVMKMSSFDSDKADLEFESLDMKMLLDKMLKSMALHFDKHQVDLQYDAIGKDFVVKGDQIHLTNVMYNLIDNAIKFSSGQPSITIVMSEEKDNVKLSIADKGMGIPKEYHSRIYDRYFRVPTEDVHDVKGYGIGLHYSAGVIKEHKGNINISSAPQSGTRFVIQLPKSI